MQQVIPMLAYRDAQAAISFLCNGFGFVERFRMEEKNGRIGHAEVALGDNVVILASVWDRAGFAAPMELPGVHSQLFCTVEDIDAHYQAARRAGATVIAAPADQSYGMRTYRALDPEGHRWIFAAPLAGASK